MLAHLVVKMILEVAILNIKPGMQSQFETAFQQASQIIAAMPGYLGHELQRCLEVDNRYLLLVRWESVEAHTIGFRRSADYELWKQQLHHFYDPFPVVEHYYSVLP